MKPEDNLNYTADYWSRKSDALSFKPNKAEGMNKEACSAENAGQAPVVAIQDGNVTADSRDVAAFFGKQHKDVLRAIRELGCSDDFKRRNFAPFKINDLTGESISHVLMTKDGFMFL